jgi:hypothetical protein
MPSAPLAAKAVTGTKEHPVAADTHACPETTKARRVPPATRPTTRGSRLINRVLLLLKRLRRVDTTSYHDPHFQRLDIVEDDYYRFRNEPRGY